jgi:hypothetical protein
MDILWSFLCAVITSVVASFVTTLVFNFFLQRMTENAKKPWRSKEHEALIRLLASPNAVARVQLPNGGDKNYEVYMPNDYRIAGGLEDKQLEAFDMMMEHKIVLPVGEQHHRLSRGYQDKYRKAVLSLAYEEFGFKSLIGQFQRLFRRK